MPRLPQRSRSPSRSRSPGRNEGLLLAERIKAIEEIKVKDRTADEKRELKKLKMRRSRGKKSFAKAAIDKEKEKRRKRDLRQNETPEQKKKRVDADGKSKREKRAKIPKRPRKPPKKATLETYVMKATGLLTEIVSERAPGAVITPTPLSLKDEIELAKDMRKEMEDLCLDKTCAVCACQVSKRDLHKSALPLLDKMFDVLRKDVPSCAKYPRDGLTIYTDDSCQYDYCLSKDGIIGEREVLVQVCLECFEPLNNGRIPDASLVRIDTGSIPEGLKPLTMYEEMLLGKCRAQRKVFFMKPSSGDTSLLQPHMRGHVIAFQNTDVEDVKASFPMRFEDIPKNMQVSG